MSSEIAKCFITHVEPFSNYLRIWVQRDHGTAVFVENQLHQLKSELQYGSYIPRSMEDLHHGLICCARFDDGNFYRTEIQNPEDAPHNAINSLFIDYGNSSLIGLADIRLLKPEVHTNLLKTPPLAIPYLLSGISFQKLSDDDIVWIKSQVQYHDILCTLITDMSEVNFIKISINHSDLTQTLLDSNVGMQMNNRDIVTALRNKSHYDQLSRQKLSKGRLVTRQNMPIPISRNQLSDQQKISSMGSLGQSLVGPRNDDGFTPAQEAPSLQQMIQTLPVGSTHNAYITHVEDGPLAFSLQLKAEADEKLPHITYMIRNSIPSLNKAPLLPGSHCLGRNPRDKVLRRAVVMDVKTGMCKVYYTDYGNCENLPYSDIYQLPHHLAQFPALALRFSLADMQHFNVTTSLKDNFEQLVQGKQVSIRVTKPEESPLVQFCEIFLNGKNVKELFSSITLSRKYMPQYLPKERDVKVIVTFFENPQKFYVQYLNEAGTLIAIKNKLATYCPFKPRLKNISDVEIGQPVCAFYLSDNSWHRGEVIDVKKEGVVIFYVDYGNADLVPVTTLTETTLDIISSWPAQAVECCLEGYDQLPPKPDIAAFIEQYILGKTLTLRLKVVVSPKRLIVDILEEDGTSFKTCLEEFSSLSKPRTQMDPKLTVTYDGSRRSVTTCEHLANKYDKDRFNRFPRNQYSEHDNRVEEEYRRCSHSVDNNRNRQWYNKGNENEKYSEKKLPNRGRTRDNERDKARGGRWNSRESHDSNDSDQKWGKHSDVEKRDKYNDNHDNGNRSFKSQDDVEKGKQRSRDSNYKNKSPRDSDEKFKNRWKDNDGRRNRNRDRDNDDRGNGRHWKECQGASYSDDITRTKIPQKPTAEVIQEKCTEHWDDDNSHYLPEGCVNANLIVAKYPTFSFQPGNHYYVQISHMITPDHFYVQGKNCSDELNKLRSLIDSDIQASLRPIGSATNIGTPVLARYSVDSLLYRGVIKQIVNSNSITVLFVDYGNSSTLSTDELFLPTEAEAVDPVQAIRCSLADIALPADQNRWETKNPRDYARYFEASDLMRVEAVRVVDGEVSLSVVLSYSDGTTVSNALIRDRLGTSQGQILPVSKFNKNIPDAFWKPQVASEEVEVKHSESLEPVKMAGKICIWPESLELLIAQYLKVKITKIINQDLFYVILSSNLVPLPCTLIKDQHGITLQPDTFAIMEVEEVLTDRVKVALFNLKDGGLLNREDTSLRRVSPVCPAPVLNSTFKVFVSHVENDKFYIQNSSDYDNIGILLEELFSHYENSSCTSKATWAEGDLCCTKSKSDENWYRARITKIDDKTATVFYFDYGNVESVDISSLKELSSEFNGCEMALETHLPVIWKMNNPPLMEIVDNIEFTCKIKRHNMIWFVDLIDSEGNNLNAKLKTLGYAEENPDSPFNELNSTIGSSLCAGDKVHVVVSHIDTPSKFWVHLAEHLEPIDNLQTDLQNIVEQMKDASEGTPIFAALYPQDNSWYRAVSSIDNAVVKFIDYGNFDTASLRKELPDQYLKPTSGYAVPMHLPVRPVGETWSTDAMQLFETFIENDSTTAEILSVMFKIIVDLKVGNASLIDKLIEAGHAVQEDLLSPFHLIYCSNISSEVPSVTEVAAPKPLDNTKSVVIVYSNSPNDFYVMEESMTESLTSVCNSLSEADSFAEPESVNVSDLIIAKFPEDEQWYRAKVLSVKPNILVQFIDYGNTSVVNMCRSFPETSVKELPGFAHHCSLGLDYIDDSCNSQFEELMEKHTFSMCVLKEGDPNIVHLEAGNVNVQELISLNFNSCNLKLNVENLNPSDENNVSGQVFVSYCEGPHNFFIQEESKQKLLDEINHSLSDIESFESVNNLDVNQIIAAKFPEDDSWYRASVQSISDNILVLSIDYGSSANVSEFKLLPEAISKIPPLVSKCCLKLPDIYESWSSEALEKFLQITCDGNKKFDVKIIQEGESMVVDLMYHNRSITEELLTLCQRIINNDPSENDLNMNLSDNQSVGEMESLKEGSNIDSNVLLPRLVKNEMENNLNEDVSNVQPTIENDSLKEGSNIDSNLLLPRLVENEIENNLNEDVSNVQPTIENDSLKEESNIDSNVLLPRIVKNEMENNLNEDVSNVQPTIENDSLKEENNFDSHVQQSKTEENGTDIAVVFISHENSLSDFYIQRKADNKKLDKIVSCLAEADTFDEVKNITVHELYCCKSASDMSWYRGILTKLEPHLEGHFIDFGISSIVSEVKWLPDKIKRIKGLAEHCQISPPAPYDKWNMDSENKFLELIGDGSTPFECVFISKTDPKVVDLIVNGQSVKEKLYDLCPLVKQSPPRTSKSSYFVSHQVGPDNFYVVDKEWMVELEKLFESLLEEESVESMAALQLGGHVCVKMGNAWYRGKVVEMEDPVKIFCYDTGITAAFEEIRLLNSGILSSLSPLAKQCKLLKPKEIIDWDEEAKVAFTDYIVKANTSGLLLKIIEDGSPMTVDLISECVSASEVLSKINQIKSKSCTGKESTVDLETVSSSLMTACESQPNIDTSLGEQLSDTSKIKMMHEDRLVPGSLSGTCMLEENNINYKPVLKEEKIVPGSISGVFIENENSSQ